MSRAGQPAIMHRAIVLSGIAGALAEVIWIAIFCALTPLSGAVVLRQITNSILPGLAASSWAPALGLMIHFVLGVAVAYAFGLLLWQSFARQPGKRVTWGMSLLALGSIWFVNFFVVLPVVNAEFVALMPYAVTLVSKLLFGVAMAATLYSFSAQPSTRTSATLAHA